MRIKLLRTSKILRNFGTFIHLLQKLNPNFFPKSITTDDGTLCYKKLIAKEFNKYFSYFLSDKKISIIYSKKFIFENFQNMIKPKEDFQFVHTTENEVADLLNELDNKSSPGYTGLPVSILKLGSDSFMPF